jgi:membrane-associated phospholipid phosphatase
MVAAAPSRLRQARHDAPRGIVAALVLAASVVVTPRLQAQGLALDPTRDSIIAGSTIGLAGVSELLIRLAPSPVPLGAADIAQVNPVDRAFLFPYSRDADVASTAMQYVSMAVPLVYGLSEDPNSALSLGLVYAESLSLAYGMKNVLKYLVPRYRPYIYTGGGLGLDRAEDDQSFPSAHATAAFTAAAFSAYLYFQHQPGGADYLPFVIANFALAGLTATYRVTSGVHFMSDVIAGAGIGMLCGFVFPAIVRK